MLSFKEYLKEAATGNLTKALPPKSPPSTSFTDAIQKRVKPEVGKDAPRIPKGVQTNEPPEKGVSLDDIVRKNMGDANKSLNAPERVEPKIKTPASRGFRNRVLDRQPPKDFAPKGFKDRVLEKEPVIEAEMTDYQPHKYYGFSGGKVLARKSPSSSGGNGGGGNGGE